MPNLILLCLFKSISRKKVGVPIMTQWVKNPTSLCEDVDLISGLNHWVKNLVATSCGIVCRYSLEPVLLLSPGKRALIDQLIELS